MDPDYVGTYTKDGAQDATEDLIDHWGATVNLRKLARRQMRLAASGMQLPFLKLRSVEVRVWVMTWPRGIPKPALSRCSKGAMAKCLALKRARKQRTGEMGDG